MKPLVSVIVPVYNAETSIAETLRSVVSQTYTNWELIIVNDGATDASENEINQFLTKEHDLSNKIKYIKQLNAGVSKARNAGMKSAKGDYIALIDSDDFWLPTKLEEQIDTIEQHPKIDLLATNRNNEYFDSFLGSKFELIVPVSSKRQMIKNFLITPTILFKREILDTVGYFNETIRHCEDLEYLIRITNNHNCFLLNKSLVITGSGKPSFGHSGLSAALWEMEKGELKNINMAFKSNILNLPEYIFISGFSFLKYIRRELVTRLRKYK